MLVNLSENSKGTIKQIKKAKMSTIDWSDQPCENDKSG